MATHSEMGPVWQNPIQRTVRTVYLSVLVTVHSLQHRTVLVIHRLTSRQPSCSSDVDVHDKENTQKSKVWILIIFVYVRYYTRAVTIK